MSKSSKVPEQKGSINSNPQTMKQMTYAEKVREAREENSLRRHGQVLDLHEPKTGKR